MISARWQPGRVTTFRLRNSILARMTQISREGESDYV
jgi:hypothetical protein